MADVPLFQFIAVRTSEEDFLLRSYGIVKWHETNFKGYYNRQTHKKSEIAIYRHPGENRNDGLMYFHSKSTAERKETAMRDTLRNINMRQRCPRHPGYILKTLYLQQLSLTISQLAEALGVSRKAISAIVNERKSITPEMALRLSRAFPNSTPESWLNLQRNYDVWNVAHTTSDWKTINAISDNLYGAESAIQVDEVTAH